MNSINEIIKNYKVMILDGAFSTELEKRGLDLNDELWSAKILADNPEMIAEVHRDYYEAGADCAITASYQATVEGFMKKGFTKEEAIELIKSSVKIAKEVRDEFWYNCKNRADRPYPLVAASVGPYGAFLADGSEYRGNYALDEEELKNFHRPRMKALIEVEPDLLACETIPCLKEALAIARVLEEFPQTYAWISFSAKDERHICSGESIAECVKALEPFKQIAAIGINCTAPEYAEGLIEEIKKYTQKPILVYPNSGESYDPTTKTWHGCATACTYGDFAKGWYEKGASIIGGCCRTSPKEIREVVKCVR